jgi:hypothetical protein
MIKNNTNFSSNGNHIVVGKVSIFAPRGHIPKMPTKKHKHRNTKRLQTRQTQLQFALNN